MGTHPIFESDFDCLTENKNMSRLICGSFNKIHVVSRTMVLSSRVLSAAPQLDDAPARVASDKVLSLVDEIANLTLQEVADLNTELKKRLNISDVQYAAAPMAAAAAPAAAPAAEAAPEAEPEVAEVKVQTEFSLTMTGFDESKKVKVIKAIKANMDGMNLVAAKKFIEALPGSIRKDVPKDEAEQVKAALEAEG